MVYHTVSKYQNCMTSLFLMTTLNIFLNNIEIAPIFLNRRSNFVLKQRFSKNKSFCMQLLSFCLHNVVVDTQKLDFFRFSGFFFKQATNSYSFCMACLHMACLKPYETQCFSFGV